MRVRWPTSWGKERCTWLLDRTHSSWFTFKLCMVETCFTFAPASAHVPSERLGCSHEAPWLKNWLAFAIGHAKGASVTKAFIEVEIGHESPDWPLYPADAVTCPCRDNVSTVGSEHFGKTHEVCEESEGGPVPTPQLTRVPYSILMNCHVLLEAVQGMDPNIETPGLAQMKSRI